MKKLEVRGAARVTRKDKTATLYFNRALTDKEMGELRELVETAFRRR